MLTADPDESLRFLRLLAPEGPWHLTAIVPDHPQELPHTRTFLPAQADAAAEFVVRRQKDGENLYYAVNELSSRNKKALKSEVSRARWIHVDADPRPRPTPYSAEELVAEQERIRARLDQPPAGAPRPTAAVASGGGVNALWRLAEPYEIDGDPLRWAEFERYNLQVEIDYGGDHCHNVDRILRLPGTINFPDDKKRRRGREPSMARLLWFDDASYPLTAFKMAPMIQGPAAGPSRPRSSVVAGNVRRLASVAELGDRVPDRVKALIVTGEDPNAPGKYDSRSQLLWHVVCELVRCEVPDDVIYSVITDPDWKVSASVLDKGSQVERYASRQIDRARDYAIAPELLEMNERYAVIANYGGKCRVVEEVEEEVGGDHGQRRSLLTHLSFEDVRNAHLNRRVSIGRDAKGREAYRSLGHWWLEHEKRRQFRRVVFSPRAEVPDAYNLWRGFSVDAVPGTNHGPWLAHVRDVICSGNEDHYRYLLGWMARCVQQPDSPGEVAVVLRGRKGTGKSRFVVPFGRLWGRHFLHVSQAKHFVGNFNSHLRDCVLLFADEAFYAGDKQHEATLKALITEDTVMVEAKGVDVVSARNYVHLVMAANAEWVVPAGGDERRYFVLDVSADKIQDHDYHASYLRALDDGGYGHLLHFLLDYDLDGFDVRKVPKTKALTEQKQFSFSSEQEWWYGKLDDGILLPHHNSWTAPVFRDGLFGDYYAYAQRAGIQRRATQTTLTRFLHQAIPGLEARHAPRTYTNDVGMRMDDRAIKWLLPALEVCRDQFDRVFGGPFPWSIPAEEAIRPTESLQDEYGGTF